MPFSTSLFRPLAPAALCIVLLIAGSASARELPGIDRLGEAPAAPASSLKRAGSDATHRHAQLNVPTFVWGQQPGAASYEKSAPAPDAASALITDPVATARDHLRRLAPLYGLPDSRIDPLPVQYSQTLKNGGAVVKFRNRIDGIEVFREEAAVLLGNDGQLVAVGGFVMGGDQNGTFFAPIPDAIAVALSDWSFADGLSSLLRASDAHDGYQYFQLPANVVSDDGSRVKSDIRVKPVLFRMPERLLPAYYIEVEIDDGQEAGVVDRYAYVIDANDKSVLYRRDQTSNAAFSYRVFAEAGGINLPLPSPTGRNGWPHPTGMPDGYQGPAVLQSLITLQNAPFSKNDPWLAANATVTTGNNVDAFADLVTPDGFTASGDVRATTTSAGVFDRAFNPALQPGANNTQIMSSVTSLFYLNNFLHDWYYDAGFDEAAGNAQTNNFGRGGLGNDSIIAEAQDFSGKSNANMSTPSDGARPRMRMYIFTAAQALSATVNTPAPIAGLKTSAGAAFGPLAFNLSADLALASDGNPTTPNQACAAIVNDVTGKIALIDRGSCTFKTKVVNAQNAGAIGVIIANNIAGNPSAMADDPSITTTVTIPSVMITQADGTTVKGQLPSPGVNVTLLSTTGTDRDGTIDNTIVAHEWGHYISNRLIADSNGLTTNMADGMGEGWADFHALLLLVKGSDVLLPANANFNGLYTIGAYVLGGPNANNNAYYYGIRRYPYSRDMTKNPLTFRHMTNGVALPASPAPRFGLDGGSNAEVHNTGEVWASMLWECYSNILNDNARLTFDQAQDRMKRYLVTGYKMTPTSPTFLEARDALLAAMAAQDGKDYALCLQGFAKRGAGVGAVSPDRFSASNAGLIESFLAGGALSLVSATITDAPGFCDADGILDNGETGTMAITMRNTGTIALSATVGSVSSANPHLTFPNGANFTFPATSPAEQVTVTIPVRFAGAVTVEIASITVTADDPALVIARPVSIPVSFVVNADEKTNQSATDTVETTHSAWTTGNSLNNAGGGYTWHRTTISGTDHRWLGPEASVPQLTWLQSPPLNVAATGNFSFTFRHRFSFETDPDGDYDGGQIQISVNGATWTDIGASALPGYTGTFAAYTGNLNPLAGLPGYVRKNPTFPALETVTVNLGTAYAGQTVRIRFVIGTDTGGTGAGWEIDDLAFNNITNTPFDAYVAHAGTCYTITTAGGTPQAALPGTPFVTPLKALVKDVSGTPAPGVSVTFSTPASGASATFGSAATVITDANGVATAPALVANAIGGAYLATASVGSQMVAYALRNSLSLSLPLPSIDVDGDGRYDALSDGLLVVRYLFGLTGNALTAGALGPNATRTSASAVAQYLDSIRGALDVDGNAQSDALTDGLLVVRYLFGMRGAALINGVVGGGATRATAPLIEAQIQLLMP